MKKVLSVLVILGIIFFPVSSVSAYTSRSSVRSYSSPSRSTYHSTPRSTSRSTPRTSQVGTSQLRSRTAAPRPHTYNGKTYNSSTAQYTNTSGAWVWYWLLVPNATTGKKDNQCFDKDHKRVTCNRDSKSYQKDW